MTSVVSFVRSEIKVRPGRARVAGLVLLGLAILTCLLALTAFPNDDTAPNGWMPYLASTVLFIASCYCLFPANGNAAAIAKPSRMVLGVLSLIMIGAIGLRFFRLDSLPFGTWNDEAYIGWTAQHILDDPRYRPIYVADYDHPLHFYALVALSFTYLGENTLAIRLVTTLFGIGAVLLAFLAGREAFGNRFGLLLAFFFAVSRWHITFSRFGVYTITLPFFELLTLWLLLRARRTGHITDFALAGLAIGFGADFYIGFRLFVVAIGIFWLYWLVTGLWNRAKSVSPAPALTKPILLAGLISFSAGAWFATAPVVQYALINPDQYWGRAGVVSIFVQRDQADLPTALYDNTVKHLLMFNFIGDSNGRHNLPGEPMLDPITGVLFVLGALLALSQIRRPIHLLFFLIFVFNLLGGILTLDFEAPQSNRAFGAIVAVLYFAALAAETVWRSLDKSNFQPLARQVTVGLLAVGLGGYATFYNVSTFFVAQANNDRSWKEYNGMQSLAAKRMLEADPSKTTIYASVFLNNHEAIRFLAPQITDSQDIIPPIGLPFREPGDKGVAVFVDNESTWIIDEAKRYYPDAAFRVDTTPGGEPILYSAVISPADIQSLQGVTAQYWFGTSTEGQPALTRDEKQIDADWTTQTPIAAPFMAEWDSTLYAPLYGQYEFDLKSPANLTLWIDGKSVLSGSGSQQATLSLAQGDHEFRIQAASGAGAVQMLWRQPDQTGALTGDPVAIPDMSLYLPAKVPVEGLLGQYFNGDSWTGPAAFTRIDPYLDMYFHIIPLPRPYTVDWSGRIMLPSTGNWTFGLRINGQAQVFIDDQSVVNATEPGDNIEGNAITLSAGPHPIHVRYYDYLGGSRIHLYWTQPGGTSTVVPSSALSPVP